MPSKEPSTKRETRFGSSDLSIFTSDLYGFWMMGRCVPSICSIHDVDVGFVNFLDDLAEWLESQELTGIKSITSDIDFILLTDGNSYENLPELFFPLFS